MEDVRRGLIAIGFVALLVAGCSSPVATPNAPGSSVIGTAEAPSVASGAPPAATAAIVGSWHRAQTCAEMLAAFQRAGLAESHVTWLTGNFFGGGPAPTSGDVCAGARGPLEHSHFFTAAGGFGSRDEHGRQVDSGDYEVIDPLVIGFPSHATEFGYDGELLIGVEVTDGIATFHILMPDECTGTCADAYAWAVSAFASGPWAAGEVP
jgi:hypothetical protein